MSKERQIDYRRPRAASAKLDTGLPEAEVLRVCTHVYLNRGDGKDTLRMIKDRGWDYVQKNAMAYASLVKLAMEAMRDPALGLEATVMPYVHEAFPPAAELTAEEIEEMMG